MNEQDYKNIGPINNKIEYYNKIEKKIKCLESEFKELLPYIKKAIDIMPETFVLNGNVIYGYENFNNVYKKLESLLENLATTKQSINYYNSSLKAKKEKIEASIKNCNTII